MKNKYHLEGVNKNKKILKERMKPLPLSLMVSELYNCVICGTNNMNKKEALKHPCKGFRDCFNIMGL